MGQEAQRQWLSDLADEAVQYREVYRQALREEREPLKKRLLERNMMDKQAQLTCLRRLGAGESGQTQPEETGPISMKLLLYNEIENQSVFMSLASCLKENEDMAQIRLKQQQIVQRLTAYLIS